MVNHQRLALRIHHLAIAKPALECLRLGLVNIDCVTEYRPTINAALGKALSIGPCHGGNVGHREAVGTRNALAVEPRLYGGQCGLQPTAHAGRGAQAVALVLLHHVGGGFLATGFARCIQPGLHPLHERVALLCAQQHLGAVEDRLHRTIGGHVDANLVHHHPRRTLGAQVFSYHVCGARLRVEEGLNVAIAAALDVKRAALFHRYGWCCRLRIRGTIGKIELLGLNL